MLSITVKDLELLDSIILPECVGYGDKTGLEIKLPGGVLFKFVDKSDSQIIFSLDEKLYGVVLSKSSWSGDWIDKALHMYEVYPATKVINYYIRVSQDTDGKVDEEVSWDGQTDGIVKSEDTKKGPGSYSGWTDDSWD